MPQQAAFLVFQKRKKIECLYTEFLLLFRWKESAEETEMKTRSLIGISAMTTSPLSGRSEPHLLHQYDIVTLFHALSLEGSLA